MIYQLRHSYLWIMLLLIIFTINKINSQDLKDSVIVQQLYQKANLCLYDKLDCDSAIMYAKRAIKLADSLKYIRGKALGYNALCAAQKKKGADYNNAVNTCMIALNLSKQLEDDILYVKNMMILIGLYSRLNEYEDALKKCYEALRFSEQHPVTYGMHEIAEIYNMIGLINYFYVKDYDKALSYFQIAFSKVPNDTITDIIRLRFAIIQNIGMLHVGAENYEQAIKYYNQALQLAQENDFESDIGLCNNNIGFLFLKRGEYNQATAYFRKALESGYNTNNQDIIVYAHTNIGRVALRQKDYNSAIYHANKGLKIALKSDDINLVNECYKILARSNEGLEKYEVAFGYLEQHLSLNDTIYNKEKSEQIANMQTKYETEKKEKEIALLKHQKAEQEAIAKQEFLWRLVLIGSSVALIIFVIIIIWSFRVKLRAKDLINIKNEEISRKKISELIKKQQIKAILEREKGQEEERKRIAQELHDGIGGALAGIKLNLERVYAHEASPTPVLERTLQNIDATFRELRSISHNLLPPNFVDNPFTQVLNSYIEHFQNKLQLNYTYYPAKLLDSINEEIQVDIYRIIQELFNNCIKHAHAKQVDIQLTGYNNYINLLFEDNGVGFDLQKYKKGIGLVNIQNRINILQGSFHIDSKPGRGTLINIDIPI